MGEQLKLKMILKFIGIVFAALLILLLVILIAFDWNWLKPYLNDRLSDINGRSLVITGNIDVDLGWTTRIVLEDVRFENADWGSEPQMARVEAAEIDVKLMPLLDGNIILPRLRLKKPRLLLETSEQGRGNWNLSPDSDTQTAEEDSGTGLPVIESLIIEDGEIRYRDPTAGTDLKGAIATEPSENSGHRIVIEAGGKLLDSQLAFRFTGDPLTDLQETGIIYQARMNAEMGRSRGEAEGVIHQPLHFKGMDLKVTIQGPDFSTPAALWDDDFPETPPYRIDTHLILENGVWKLKASTASLGESDFTGAVTIDPTADPLAITADLDFDLLDVEQLSAIFKEEEKTQSEASSETGLDASLLTGLNADFQVRANSIVMPKVPVNRGDFHLRLEDGRLRIDPLELELADGTVNASVTAQPAEPGIKGSAVIDFKNIDLSELDISGKNSGGVSGRLVLKLPPTQHLDLIWAGLNIEKSRLRYQDPVASTDLAADFQTEEKGGKHRIQANISGEYEGRSLNLSVSGGAVSDWFDLKKPVSVSVSGTVNEQPIQLDADLVQRESTWNLENIDTRLADSDLKGHIRMDTGGDRPEIVADLTSETLNVKRLTAFAEAVADRESVSRRTAQDEPKDRKDGKASSPNQAEPIELEVLSEFDADIRIEADRIVAPDIPLEDVRLDLNLEKGQLSVSPLKFNLHGGTVSAEVSLDAAEDPLSGTIAANFEQLDLAKILDPFTDLDPDELGILSGDLDMTLTQADPTALNRDILLPYLGMLKIEESRLSYVNPPKDTDVTFSAQTHRGSDREPPARITGNGRYRGEPFNLSFRGDPLLDLREPDDSYFFDLKMEAADTRAEITGEFRHPFDLKGFDITLNMAGPNPARLYPLIGVSLPDLPPYDLKGRLSLKDGVWKFQDFQGRVGDSDLSGNIRIDTAGEKPDLTADLSSEHLDFDDLSGLVGAAPGTGPGETASPAQQREAAREARDETVLPAEPYGMERLKAMNAAVAYRAKRVNAPDLPLDEVDIDFNLKGGGMMFEPLKFEIGEGSVDVSLSLEPKDGTFQGLVEAEIKRVDLKRALKRFDIADDSAGIIGGRAKFWFQGMSMADLLASADGGTYLLMTGGKLDSLLIELAGLDAGEAIIAWFNDPDSVRIDCGYADIHSRDGVMTLEKFIVDTVDTLFSISGTIRFGEETLDLLIHPQPKDFSLFSARVPLHITGTFENPEAFPDRSALTARGAAALGLGLVAGPAAILPLLEPGATGEPAICQGMIESIKEAQ